MTEQLLGLAALVALGLWIAQRTIAAAARGRGARTAAEIDRGELEAAEREVRDLGSSVREDDGFVGDDWGPGAGGGTRGTGV